MKSILKISVLIIALSSILVSCKKYVDGPMVSLRTKKARLTGDWVIDKVTVNGEDKTADYQAVQGANFVLKIEKDEKYHTEGAFPDAGSWKLGEDKDDVYFTSDQPGSKEQPFRILRLKNKELWLKATDIFANVTEIHYKAEKD